MLIQKLSDSASIQHRYLYDYFVNTLGWFSHNTPGKGQFKLTFSESEKKGIQRSSENLSTIFINEQTAQVMENRLSCRDAPSPDHEPLPLKVAELDLILKDFQQEMVTFCQQHKIPFLSKMPWPLGNPFALVISHDIDLIRKYGPRILAKDLFTVNFKKFRQHFAQSVYRENLYWNFDDILDFYDNAVDDGILVGVGKGTSADNKINVKTTIVLSWIGGDEDGDDVFYDVYLGTSNPPITMVSYNQSEEFYDPDPDLSSGTTYYWQIIARDVQGATTTGPIWSFETR